MEVRKDSPGTPSGHRPEVWTCFASMTLALVSLQVAAEKLILSMDTAKGVAVAGAGLAFAGVSALELPRLDRRIPNSLYTDRGKILRFFALTGIGSLSLSMYIVWVWLGRGGMANTAVGLAGAALLSFIGGLFITALYFGTRVAA